MTAKLRALMNSLQRLQLSDNSVPLALLLLALLAYGLLSRFTGFYGDEWHMVYEYVMRKTPGVLEYFFYDGHPLVAWLYLLGFKLCGSSTMAWQLYSLSLRWLSAVSFWLVLQRVWPRQRLETCVAAIVFMLYPQFYMQAQSLAYFEVWASHTFLWLSFYFSLRAIQEPQRMWKFVLLALLFKAGHVFTGEYTWGVELLRPVFLWLALPAATGWRERFGPVVKMSGVFLLVFLAMSVWRGFIYASPVAGRSLPYFVQHLQEKPARALLSFGLNVFPDLALLLGSTWYKLIQPEWFNFGSPFNILMLLLVLGSGLLVWFYLAKISRDESDSKAAGLFFVGVLGLFFGMVPFYAAGRFLWANIEPWNGRYALGSMPGIALMTVAVIAFFIRTRPQKIIFFALLTGLMLGWQFRGMNEFRKSWNEQERFYQQLLWRAPGLQPGTTIIADGDPLPLMRDMGTTFAINMVYNKMPTPKGEIAYWFFSIPDVETRAALKKLMQLPESSLTKYYNSLIFKPENTIFVSYQPGESRCLWLVNEDLQPFVPGLDEFQPIRAENAVRLISAKNSQDMSLFTQIFGAQAENKSDWCYYFQKADLAAQEKDWATVAHFWETAQANGVAPSDAAEYLPFIKAQLFLGNWRMALRLTEQADKQAQGQAQGYCPLWRSLPPQLPSAPDKDSTIAEALTTLGCPGNP